VTEGLKPGERGVVEGGDRVRAGQKVRPAATRPPSRAPTEVFRSHGRFFIDRPIVAMSHLDLMVIFGVVAIVQLPIALYPNIRAAGDSADRAYPGPMP